MYGRMCVKEEEISYQLTTNHMINPHKRQIIAHKQRPIVWFLSNITINGTSYMSIYDQSYEAYSK